MGNYATKTSIYLMLPGFLKDNTSASTDSFGTLMFDRQILNAESLVNAAVAPNYSISDFTAIPPLLRKLTEDIAIYNVIKATGYRADDRNEYLDDFERAMDMLDSIRKGETKLTYTNGSDIPVLSNKILCDKSDYTPIFNLDDPTSWEVDPDQLDDIESERR